MYFPLVTRVVRINIYCPCCGRHLRDNIDLIAYNNNIHNLDITPIFANEEGGAQRWLKIESKTELEL